MNVLEGGKGGEGRVGGERVGRGWGRVGERGWGGDVGERGWGDGGEREGGEGGWGGRGGEGREGGGGEGGMTVIHILIGMFNSNPMIPQYLNNNLT